MEIKLKSCQSKKKKERTWSSVKNATGQFVWLKKLLGNFIVCDYSRLIFVKDCLRDSQGTPVTQLWADKKVGHLFYIDGSYLKGSCSYFGRLSTDLYYRSELSFSLDIHSPRYSTSNNLQLFRSLYKRSELTPCEIDMRPDLWTFPQKMRNEKWVALGRAQPRWKFEILFDITIRHFVKFGIEEDASFHASLPRDPIILSQLVCKVGI